MKTTWKIIKYNFRIVNNSITVGQPDVNTEVGSPLSPNQFVDYFNNNANVQFGNMSQPAPYPPNFNPLTFSFIIAAGNDIISII